MLIRRAQVWGTGLADLRLADGRIDAIGRLEAIADEAVFDARGGALLPGLHDHHLHLMASAVRGQSLICGPPEIATASELATRLAKAPGHGWIRGILYHDSVMGLPGAAELDALMPHRPLRVQHRSGRMWLLNSLALEDLLARAAPPPGLERQDGRFTGRLFDEDSWLRQVIGAGPPDLATLSATLAGFGVTGVTDMSPHNGLAEAKHFAAQSLSGTLSQRCLVSGGLDLEDLPKPLGAPGPYKLHLHENALPDLDEVARQIRAAHDAGRALASHCTTETELVFTLAALEAAGAAPGDRIEHAGIARDEHIAMMADLGLAVVSQPHFIAERGDQYLADVEPNLHGALYRLASFRRAGIVLAAGSDAPFGTLDPWAAMRAATSRRTHDGAVIEADEALTPEEAIELYLANPRDLSRQRKISLGEPANLCLLDRPWEAARERLDSSDVRAVLIAGRIVYQRIDDAPVESLSG